MKVLIHKSFDKAFKRLTKSQKQKFKERKNLFMQDEFDVLLNNHVLSGKYKGYRSINITGDIRLIYKRINDQTVAFISIGSHSALYG